VSLACSGYAGQDREKGTYVLLERKAVRCCSRVQASNFKVRQFLAACRVYRHDPLYLPLAAHWLARFLATLSRLVMPWSATPIARGLYVTHGSPGPVAICEHGNVVYSSCAEALRRHWCRVPGQSVSSHSKMISIYTVLNWCNSVVHRLIFVNILI
jgi:hypothetical protein